MAENAQMSQIFLMKKEKQEELNKRYADVVKNADIYEVDGEWVEVDITLQPSGLHQFKATLHICRGMNNPSRWTGYFMDEYELKDDSKSNYLRDNEKGIIQFISTVYPATRLLLIYGGSID